MNKIIVLMLFETINYTMGDIIRISAFSLVFPGTLYFYDLWMPAKSDDPAERIAPMKIIFTVFYRHD